MATAVTLPKQGQSVETCIITQWYKNSGDNVKEGEVLFSYETDKAAFDEEAKVSGTLLEIFFNAGDEVPVLTDIAVIGSPGESTDKYRLFSETHKESGMSGNNKTETPPHRQLDHRDQDENKIRISPRAKSLAIAQDINFKQIDGTGPNGRIIVRDIENLINTGSSNSPEGQELNVSKGNDFTIKPLSNIRRIIGEKMDYSLKNSAQLTHHLSADARKILALRSDIKKRMENEKVTDVSLNDIVCFAVVQSLTMNPDINIHYLNNQIKYFHKVHLGFAVDTDRGLMVPVIKNADDYSLSGLSTQLKKLAHDCRNNKINPELLQSNEGSFTVSNLGSYGIEMFTPVLNLPQVGIIGVNTISLQPRELKEGGIGLIPVIGLSLTYDHRAIDGAPASSFLMTLKNNIENFDPGK